MRTMRVARLYDVDDIRIEEAPIPAIGPDEILVRTAACGICSGDLVPWYIRRKAPLVLGHEPAGRVVEVGSNVRGYAPGDRVFVHHHAPCFHCRFCRRGAYSMCETWRRSHLDPGGMAEFFRVPAVNLHDTLLLPEELSFEDGTLIEPVACAVKALHRARIAPGATVLVIGLGVMGQILARLARFFGAGRLLTADLLPQRRELSRRLGADAALDPRAGELSEQVAAANDGELADVVVVGPPSTEALATGIACAGRGGTVVQFSPTPPGETLTLDTHRLYLDEITLVPSYSCGPGDTREALALVRAGAVRAADLVTHRYPLAETARAYREMRERKEVLKAVIVMGVEV